MRVSEFMTTNVVTVSSKTALFEARKFIVAHNIRRLPVVDRGKLVGIVSDRRIASASPSSHTTLSVWEMNEWLNKVTVGELMKKNLTTVTPDTTAEVAVALAQKNKVGSLLVIDDERLVGIVTTNDFFYRILNPLLGIGKPGTRLHIFDCGETGKIEGVMKLLGRHNMEIVAIHLDESDERPGRDLIIQVNGKEAGKLIEDLTAGGYRVEVRG